MNIYYDPENFGLEIVASEDRGYTYEFDMVVVWKNKQGDLFWASDSGCSCPTPFEWASLANINHIETYKDLKEFCDFVLDKHPYEERQGWARGGEMAAVVTNQWAMNVVIDEVRDTTEADWS